MNLSSHQIIVSWKERSSSVMPVNLNLILIFFSSSSKYLSWSVNLRSVLICYTTLSSTHFQVPLISGTLRLYLSFCAHSNHSMGIMNEPTCKPREERRRLFRTNYLMQIAATSSYSQQPLSGLLFFVAVISTYYLCHTVYFFVKQTESIRTASE